MHCAKRYPCTDKCLRCTAPRQARFASSSYASTPAVAKNLTRHCCCRPPACRRAALLLLPDQIAPFVSSICRRQTNSRQPLPELLLQGRLQAAQRRRRTEQRQPPLQPQCVRQVVHCRYRIGHGIRYDAENFRFGPATGMNRQSACPLQSPQEHQPRFFKCMCERHDADELHRVGLLLDVDTFSEKASCAHNNVEDLMKISPSVPMPGCDSQRAAARARSQARAVMRNVLTGCKHTNRLLSIWMTNPESLSHPQQAVARARPQARAVTRNVLTGCKHKLLCRAQDLTVSRVGSSSSSVRQQQPIAAASFSLTLQKYADQLSHLSEGSVNRPQAVVRLQQQQQRPRHPLQELRCIRRKLLRIPVHSTQIHHQCLSHNIMSLALQ